jgi:hypothetical protein
MKVPVLLVASSTSCGGLTGASQSHPGSEAGTAVDALPPQDGELGEVAATEAGPADAPEPCAAVGKGPGLEACCGGQFCRGQCGMQGECVCYGAGAIGGCPPGAACCKTLVNGSPYGPVCVGPQDCIPD